MASNSEGVWNGASASVALEVEPQLAETWWFRVTGLCLTAAAIFAGFRYRLARVHAAMNLRLEERVAERTRIARELHDTLLQSFQGLMLRLQVVDDLLPPGKAKEQLEQSLQRADQAIAEGRSAVYHLRSSVTTSNDLAEAVRPLGDELAIHDSPAFQLVVEGPTRDLHPIIHDELYRITREALRNASATRQPTTLKPKLPTENGYSGCASGTTDRVFHPRCWQRAGPATTVFRECVNAPSKSVQNWRSGVEPRPVQKLN